MTDEISSGSSGTGPGKQMHGCRPRSVFKVVRSVSSKWVKGKGGAEMGDSRFMVMEAHAQLSMFKWIHCKWNSHGGWWMWMVCAHGWVRWWICDADKSHPHKLIIRHGGKVHIGMRFSKDKLFIKAGKANEIQGLVPVTQYCWVDWSKIMRRPFQSAEQMLTIRTKRSVSKTLSPNALFCICLNTSFYFPILDVTLLKCSIRSKTEKENH